MTEAETGVLQLQTEELRRLPARCQKLKRSREGCPYRFQRERRQPCQLLDFGLPTSTTMRQHISLFLAIQSVVLGDDSSRKWLQPPYLWSQRSHPLQLPRGPTFLVLMKSACATALPSSSCLPPAKLLLKNSSLNEDALRPHEVTGTILGDWRYGSTSKAIFFLKMIMQSFDCFSYCIL